MPRTGILAGVLGAAEKEKKGENLLKHGAEKRIKTKGASYVKALMKGAEGKKVKTHPEQLLIDIPLSIKHFTAQGEVGAKAAQGLFKSWESEIIGFNVNSQDENNVNLIYLINRSGLPRSARQFLQQQVNKRKKK